MISKEEQRAIREASKASEKRKPTKEERERADRQLDTSDIEVVKTKE